MTNTNNGNNIKSKSFSSPLKKGDVLSIYINHLSDMFYGLNQPDFRDLDFITNLNNNKKSEITFQVFCDFSYENTLQADIDIITSENNPTTKYEKSIFKIEKNDNNK